MCGRFSLTTDEQQLNLFFRLAGGSAPYVPRYNGAPTQKLAVITGEGPRKLQYYRWGLIPFWAKEVPRSKPIINARAESIMEKPTFKRPFLSHRCLVPSDGFYEWKQNGGKRPYRITMDNGLPFAMAGIWDKWMGENDETIYSFAIITTGPNGLMKSIHDRMPVILDPSKYDEWLNNDDEKALRGLLKPFPENQMMAYRVSDKVNSVRNEGEELIRPYEENSLFS